MYSYEEAIEASLKYFKGDKLATDAFISKYALKDVKGNLLERTPDDMHKRLAREFSRIENNYPNPLPEDEIYNLLKDFKYIIPGGSPMMGIGNDNLLTSLSNCFVIGSPYDSYSGIMNTEQQMVSVMKRRGGVGVAIDSLRSKNIPTTSVSEKSSGVVLFSERYSNTTREVAQDGRRGALMISCRVDHPDIVDFIEAKTDLNKITGANVSVMITDSFMEAVKNDSDYELYFEMPSGLRYGKFTSARSVWNKIIQSAWKSAEPGVLFWDTILRESPADCYAQYGFKTVSTNPCGEIPLSPFDSCRLMALNLYSYVVNPFTNNSYFDYELFDNHVHIAQRLMDDIVDLEVEKINSIIKKIENDVDPEELKQVELKTWRKIKEAAINGRRTGLGITAEGDMLAALGLRYGSDEGIEVSERVHKIMAVSSYKSSIEMAKERGCFPVCNTELEKNNPFLKRIFPTLYCEANDYHKYGRRNIANLTIAPTGTVSLMTQTTSGIEPVFMVRYKRKRKVQVKGKNTTTDNQGDIWEEYYVIHPKFIDWYELNWYKIDSNWFDINYKPSIEDCDDETFNKIFKASPYYKSTANDIDWVAKVKMQGRIQKWIDHSISVTVNLPNNTTVETVDKIYMTAYEVGCKGLTIYRDGCRQGILTNIESKSSEFNYIDAPKRGKSLNCDIYTKTALGRDFTIIVGLMNEKPYEIFAFEQLSNTEFPKDIKKGVLTKTKSRVYKLSGVRGDKEYMVENILSLMKEDELVNTRRYSLQLRHGINPFYIHEQIDKYATITSFDKVIGRVLKMYTNGEKTKDLCPQCGSLLVMQDGCEKCPNCIYSKC
jgi:ribonucleoside-diphosphate reductase alpha chain